MPVTPNSNTATSTGSNPARLGRWMLVLLLWWGMPAHAEISATPDTACYDSLDDRFVLFDTCAAALKDAELENNPELRNLRTARIHSALAMLYARNGALAPAREQMNLALGAAPKDLIVQANNGNLLLRESAFVRAIEVYNAVLSELVEEPPNVYMRAGLYLNRSLALRGLGHYDEAAGDFALHISQLASSTTQPQSQTKPPSETEKEAAASRQMQNR